MGKFLTFFNELFRHFRGETHEKAVSMIRGRDSKDVTTEYKCIASAKRTCLLVVLICGMLLSETSYLYLVKSSVIELRMINIGYVFPFFQVSSFMKH
jgi:hypothetical protein